MPTRTRRSIASRSAVFSALVATVATSAANATPGPDSVAVLGNASVPESVALGQQYATARNVPANQICNVTVPDQDSITLDEYRTMVLAPFEACLMRNGVIDRIEAVVLVRGIPIRVTVPVTGGGMQSVSLAAALQTWHSRATTGSMMPLLGMDPGNSLMCGGSTCYAARWRNPYITGAFSPAFTETVQGIEWHPLLVTMLNARSYTDAALLVTSAITAEQMGGARGTFGFMNGADPARGVLDMEYDSVIQSLGTFGFTDAVRVPFDANATGGPFAAFFTGTASLGTTIESNTFLPGSLVDNLTSYGADPVNFHATGESQVSIARFVARGASGAHGTVDEPLNNVFPSRNLIVDYVRGFTLAESYLRNMPYAYWRNLVLGDPMLAPYAQRPRVTVTGLSEGEMHAGAARIVVDAEGTAMRAVETVDLFVDGVRVEHVMGSHLETCWVPSTPGAHSLLAVAQLADDADMDGPRSKGWRAIAFTTSPGSMDCNAANTDAGSERVDASTRTDGGLDGGTGMMPGGCGCAVPGGERSTRRMIAWSLFVASVALARRRRVGPQPHA